MTGSRSGVATQLQTEESRAVLTHCYEHSLNLAIGDTVKQSKVCRDALNVAFEISKLIRFSSKRNLALDRIRVENPTDNEEPNVGIRAFCPTRWTVRGEAIQSTIENCSILNQLWDKSLETKLDPDVMIKGRIIGVQTQMSQFKLFFGLHLCKKILKITDNLSQTLQSQSMSAAEGEDIAQLSVQTLEGLRTDESFALFFELVSRCRESSSVSEPVLPRKRKFPGRFQVGMGEAVYSAPVEEHYRLQYYECLDLAISGIRDRFRQSGYATHSNLESLLITAANEAILVLIFSK